MRKQGFSLDWILWTRALYKGAHTSVLVNGESDEEFEMERGVRQGCLIVPYFYLFVADVLSHMINDPKWDIQGFKMSDGNILHEALFADNMALCLHGTSENLDKAFLFLNQFCQASGAKLNWSKCYAIWASNNHKGWT